MKVGSLSGYLEMVKMVIAKCAPFWRRFSVNSIYIYIQTGIYSSHVESDSFRKLGAGKLGTHSLRKGPATYCARCGMLKDHVNCRGRWHSSSAQVDTYIGIDEPYPDALIASCLTGPSGPIKYSICAGAEAVASDEFMSSYIAPGIYKLVGPLLGKTLGLALLWGATATDNSHRDFPLVPDDMRANIEGAVRQKLGVSSTAPLPNIVRRVPIIIGGSGGVLNICEAGVAEGSGATGNMGGAGTQQDLITQVVSVQSQLIGVKRRLEEIRAEMQGEARERAERQEGLLRRINNNVKRIAIQPVVRTAAQQLSDNVSGADSRATLSSRPKTLSDLWMEYEFGIDGRKAARLFTSLERGKCRYMYSRRYNFWAVVDRMVRSGYTSDAAIEKIYNVHGNGSPVSKILVELGHDKRRGGHPELM